VVLEQGIQAALERLVIDPEQVVHERLDVDLAGVRNQLVQDAVGVGPPERIMSFRASSSSIRSRG